MSPSFLTSMLLLTLFLFGTVFLIPINNRIIYPFPFDYPFWPCSAGMGITIKSYLYFLFVELDKLILCIIIYNETNIPKLIVGTFIWLMALRLFDYLLNYNQVWHYILDFPFIGNKITVSCNTVSCLIFGIAIILNEFKWSRQQIK